MSIKISVEDTMGIMLEILKVYDSFCRANNLRYSLLGGTAIGAVRHKGFIPWDDDIDVVMPRCDYELFLKTFNNPNYSIFNHNHHSYYQPFSKLVDNRTFGSCIQNDDVYGVFLDIFPADDIDLYKFHTHKLKLLKSIRILRQYDITKFVSFKNLPKRNCVFLRWLKINLIIIFKSIRNVFISYDFYYKRYIDIVNSIKGSDAYLELAFRANKECIYSIDSFDKLIDIEFESGRFLIFQEYDRYLRAYFGDYMVLPPKDKRVSMHSYYSFYYK